jgi:phospholipid/cholesterol/gamma-HCH transport system substrate-binding protein
MLRRRRLVGLAVLVAAVAGSWLGITKPDPFSHDEVVHVTFDHVQGIALVQRDVRVAGVNVGTIGAVRRVGTQAEVDLLLHQHIPVYRDATAALRPHTPFEGTTFVDLNPGTPATGALGDAPIPPTHTTVFVSAGDILSTFTAPVRHSFQVIVHELALALQRPGQIGLSTAIHNAPALLQQTAVVAPALRGPHQSELRTMIRPLAFTVNALAGQDGELASAVHNVRRTLDAVATDNAVPFDRSLQALPGALQSATSAGNELVAVLRRADSAAGALMPTLGAIPPTTRALIPLLDRAGALFPHVPPIVTDFAASLMSLARNSPALARLFATLRAPASLLRFGLVPYFDSRSKFGLPNYLQLMSATAGFTGALSSFVTSDQTSFATGHTLRGNLQGPITLPFGALNSPIPCSAIAKLNPAAVSIAQALGLCTP